MYPPNIHQYTMMYIRKPIITQTQHGLIHSMLVKTYKSCVKICDISVSLSLFFSPVLGMTISQGVMLFHLARAVKDQQITVQSYSRKRLRRTMQKGRWVLSFFVMADAVNLPEPKGLPTLLGLNQKWCGIFSDCYMYTGLKGGDCLMDGGFIPWKKSNRDETRIVYGFRLIPKMKDCDFKVYLSATKRGATIRNSKDCMTNDKWMTFIDETHFWESPFSGRGFLVLGFYFLR